MKQATEGRDAFEGWAILELMGHRKLAGYVREQELAGAGFVRIDVPKRTGKGYTATQFYSPGAVYCLTPTSEALARQYAASCQPEPVSRWELPAHEERRGLHDPRRGEDDMP